MSTEKEVQDLSAGWRNYVSQQMGLTDSTFQLAIGGLGLQTTDDSGLFLMADALPSPTSVGHYNPNSTKKRSSAYGLLLGGLLPDTSANLQTELGTYYTAWMTWKEKHPQKDDETFSDYIDRAIKFGNDAGVINGLKNYRAIEALSQYSKASDAYNDPNNQQTFYPAGGGPKFSLYTYTGVLANAKSQINRGGSVDIDFDSASMNTSTNSAFIGGSASGFYDIFSGSAAGSYKSLTSKAASSGFTIKGKINKFATLDTAPGNWYSSGQVNRAFNAPNDNTIWNPDSNNGDWNSFFDPKTGAMPRYVSSLVLVSDYSITITSKATYSSSEFEQINTDTSFGVWPFFSGSVSSSHTTSKSLNSKSQLEVTYTLNKGLIQIWGVNIEEQ